MRRLFVVVSFLILSGCGIAAKIDARTEYQASTANYKTCLASNAAAPRNCEGLRLAMEADERKFNNMSAGTNSGSQITVLNR